MAAAECQKHPVRWLTVEDIRKQQRMRRDVVVAAMLAGDLPYEQRGRIRYARITDVQAWEDSRYAATKVPSACSFIRTSRSLPLKPARAWAGRPAHCRPLRPAFFKVSSDQLHSLH